MCGATTNRRPGSTREIRGARILRSGNAILPLNEVIRSTIVAIRLISSARPTLVNEPARRLPNDVHPIAPARRADAVGRSLLRSWLSSRW
jgi:hypothetical protein